MIDYAKIWQFVNARNAADAMTINNTFYLIHYGGEALVAAEYRRADNTPLYKNLCDYYDIDSAAHFATWADAEEMIRQIHAAEDADNLNACLRYNCWIERIDEQLKVSVVAERFELYLLPGETREDGVDRIASHFFGAEDVPAYVTECKPLIVKYFKLLRLADETYDTMTAEDMDAYYDYLGRLSSAKAEVSKVETELVNQAMSGSSNPIAAMMGLEE